MKNLLKKIIAVSILSGTVIVSAAFAGPNIVTIRYDPGGLILQYLIKMKKYEKAGTHIRFTGKCFSACTLYLALPANRLCVTPKTEFSFHLPYGSTKAGNKKAVDLLMKNYPSWVRNWIHSSGGLTVGFKTMKYDYVKRFIKTC